MTQTTTKPLTAALFEMPDVFTEEDVSFIGYSDGSTWNGFGCPFFENSEADRLVSEWNMAIKPKVLARYDAATDSYIFPQEDVDSEEAEEVDRFEGLDRDGKHLYAIGAWCWVWHEMENKVGYTLEVHKASDDEVQLWDESAEYQDFQVICFRLADDTPEWGGMLLVDARLNDTMRGVVEPESYWGLPADVVEAVSRVNDLLRSKAGMVGLY